MKFVRLNSNFPVTKVENNLKKANYYKDGDEAYTLWDVGDFDKNQLGIHLSYNSDKKKIVAYYEDGVEHKNFFAPITEVFTGKIVEKDGKTSVKGVIRMSPVFNITIILCYIAIIGLFIGLKDQRANIAVITCVFVVYFMYAKKAYRDNMTKIAMFLGSITTGTQKIKKANPNKKKGKWAGKHY